MAVELSENLRALHCFTLVASNELKITITTTNKLTKISKLLNIFVQPFHAPHSFDQNSTTLRTSILFNEW